MSDVQVESKDQFQEEVELSFFRARLSFEFQPGVPLPSELQVRHPLQNRWALWYLKADRSKDWEDCLKVRNLRICLTNCAFEN